MFKIKYIPTGNIFVLPKKDAELLKEKSPQDYLILEKNGKKFRDKIPQKIESNSQQVELNVPKGCYILKIDNIVRKVSIS